MPSAPAAPLLRVEGLAAWYGEAQALRDVSFEVAEGETVTLVGRNGAGKTTTLLCLMGLHPQARGQMLLEGKDIGRLSPPQRARRGMGYVPDDRGIYATLPVEQNLRFATAVADRHYLLAQGAVVNVLTNQEVREREGQLLEYMGV